MISQLIQFEDADLSNSHENKEILIQMLTYCIFERYETVQDRIMILSSQIIPLMSLDEIESMEIVEYIFENEFNFHSLTCLKEILEKEINLTIQQLIVMYSFMIKNIQSNDLFELQSLMEIIIVITKKQLRLPDELVQSICFQTQRLLNHDDSIIPIHLYCLHQIVVAYPTCNQKLVIFHLCLKVLRLSFYSSYIQRLQKGM
jgi:hypothetical protein